VLIGEEASYVFHDSYLVLSFKAFMAKTTFLLGIVD